MQGEEQSAFEQVENFQRAVVRRAYEVVAGGVEGKLVHRAAVDFMRKFG